MNTFTQAETEAAEQITPLLLAHLEELAMYRAASYAHPEDQAAAATALVALVIEKLTKDK